MSSKFLCAALRAWEDLDIQLKLLVPGTPEVGQIKAPGVCPWCATSTAWKPSTRYTRTLLRLLCDVFDDGG